MNRSANQSTVGVKALFLALMTALFTLASGGLAKAQEAGQEVLTGKIVDAVTGEAIIGAGVTFKNTTVGTVSDMDGNFSLPVPKEQATSETLVFSCLGYETQEYALKNGRSNIRVALSSSSQSLDDVVVVGYGVQRKESVIGSISRVTSNDLKLPAGQLSTNLAGQVAGVVSIQRTGEPGSHSDFWIRGISSLNSESRAPLVLVDGIERELDLVDPEDIQTFSVLKDATATAVYGVRGANGVILITTRSGDIGAPKVSVRGEAGVVQPTQMPEFVNAAQFVKLYNEAYQYTNPVPYYDDTVVRKYNDGSDPDLYPDVNWMSELFRPISSNQRVNTSISGGGKTVKYYVSGSFYNESSIYKNDGLQKYNTSANYNKFNFRANIDINLSRSTVLTVNLSNIYESKVAPSTSSADIWKSAFTVSPNIIPRRYSDGSLSEVQGSSSGQNPYNLITQKGFRNVYANNAQTLLGLTQDLGDIVTKGLKANVKFSWDAVTGQTQTYTASPQTWYANQRDENGNLILQEVKAGSSKMDYAKSSTGMKTTYLEASLTYDRFFGRHNIGGLFLYNQKSAKNIQAGNIDNSRPYRHQGIAGRLTYSYDYRYFLEGNFGYNGSENFSPGKRFGFFPSIALGWMLSNEKFFASASKVFDVLKFRASYGIVGNDKIGSNRRFIYNGTFTDINNAYQFGETLTNYGGIHFGEFANSNVSWEKSYKMDLGVEMSLFNTVKIQADYFNDRRKGIFLKYEDISSVVGLQSRPYINIGETKNRGVDVQVEGTKRLGEVKLSLRGNFTFSRSEVINNAQPKPVYDYLSEIGLPIDQQFGLIAEGLFQTEEEIANSPTPSGLVRVGDIKYKDTNEDGIINELDYVPIGRSWLPEINYGFGFTLQYRNFDLSALFQGVGNVTMFLNGAAVWPFSNNDIKVSNFYKYVYDNTWTLENPDFDAEFPRVGTIKSTNNTQYTSTFWQRDMSYLRLKNLTLGYTMPQRIMSKAHMSQMRIYVQGLNLLTFSKFKMFDPEIGAGSSSSAAGQGAVYPPSRMITLGLNFSF